MNIHIRVSCIFIWYCTDPIPRLYVFCHMRCLSTCHGGLLAAGFKLLCVGRIVTSLFRLSSFLEYHVSSLVGIQLTDNRVTDDVAEAARPGAARARRR